MKTRIVNVSQVPVQVEAGCISMRLSVLAAAPSTTVSFTTLESLKDAIDNLFKDVTEPVCVTFRLPAGERKPPGFDAFIETLRYRNIPEHG